jgi:cytochrome P450
MTARALMPPGPGRLFYLRHQPHVFQKLARKYGDIVSFRIRSRQVYLVSRPDLVAQVLRDHDASFVKEWGPRRGHPVLDPGLLTSEGADHRTQRQSLSKAFSRSAMAEQRPVIAEVIADWSARRKHGETIDVVREMSLLASDLVARVVLGSRVDPATLYEFGEVVMTGFRPSILPFGIRRRPSDPRPSGAALLEQLRRNRYREGLLSMLFDMPGADSQIMTFVIAGQETIRLAMTWSWFLMSMHPEVKKRLEEEADGGGEPVFADAVMREAMRLYPPQWMLGKRAIVDYPLGEYVVPRGDIVLTCPYVVHRDERWFPEADRFLPQRWIDRDSSPAYFPFGGGSRRCIGEFFAMIEGTTMLSMLARQWSFVCRPRDAAIDARLSITPRKMLARVEAR